MHSTKRVLQATPVPRRSVLNVPGHAWNRIEKCRTLAADSFVLDLEDGVAMDQKAQARVNVVKALNTLQLPGEMAVRMNAMTSGMAETDVAALVAADHLTTVVIPKVHSAADVTACRRLLTEMAEKAGRPPAWAAGIRFLVCIESAQGLLNAQEIAQADPRVEGLIFASEDYCADTLIARTPDLRYMSYARQKVVTVAVAYGKQAIDLVCIDYKNQDQLIWETEDARGMGFTGKQAIHPGQIDTINRTLVPKAADIRRAAGIVAQMERDGNTGLVFVYEGIVVDRPVMLWATRLLSSCPSEILAQALADKSV